jgi:hypothetical protein
MVGLGGLVEVCLSDCHYGFQARRHLSSLSEPAVEEYDDAVEGRVFVITRYVVGIDQHVRRIKERVTDLGDYDLQDTTIVEADASKLGIVHVGQQ